VTGEIRFAGHLVIPREGLMQTVRHVGRNVAAVAASIYSSSTATTGIRASSVV